MEERFINLREYWANHFFRSLREKVVEDFMHLIRKSKIQSRWSLASLVAGVSLLTLCTSAKADVVRNDNPDIEGFSNGLVREWKDVDVKPKAVAIAVHGLVLHGGVYDKLARELASQGFVVVAPDLRGYGRWSPEHKQHSHSSVSEADNATVVSLGDDETAEQSVSQCKRCKADQSTSGKISYSKSYGDLKELVTAVRNHYPALPLYVIGESLGAGMALRLASDMPQSIDGIVLSSPAIKHRIYMEPRMVVDLTALMFSPSKIVDVAPYIKRFASEDPQIVEAALHDPLVRKKMPMVDLLKTSKLIRGNIRFASKIPAEMPVLIIQGDRDRMLKSNGVVTLLGHLKSRDQTVRWFPGRGHLLLETPHIPPETMETVSHWLTSHANDAGRTKTTVTKPSNAFEGLN